jgi:hypothetical protein
LTKLKVSLLREDLEVGVKWLPAWESVVNCQLRVEFCKEGCEDRVREGEESPMLEAIARDQLMKTRQAGKKLSGYCGDL